VLRALLGVFFFLVFPLSGLAARSGRYGRNLHPLDVLELLIALCPPKDGLFVAAEQSRLRLQPLEVLSRAAQERDPERLSHFPGDTGYGRGRGGIPTQASLSPRRAFSAAPPQELRF